MAQIDEIISHLRQQSELLNNLASTLERKSDFDDDDRALYDEISKQVEKNLKQIRTRAKSY